MNQFMPDVVTMARREWAALALTATLWGALAIVAFVTGVIFGIAVLVPGAPAELRTVAAAAGWAMLLTAPALSLRPTTEERRTGFWEVLATSPASTGALVLGRYAAGMAALIVLCAVGLGGPYVVLELLARPDPAEALCATTGVLLAASMYLASGMFFGSLVHSAAVAYMATFFSWLTLLLAVRSLAPLLASSQADLLFAADPVRRLEGFLDGAFDTSNIVYFASATAAFLIASVAVQSSEAERASGRGRIGVQVRIVVTVLGSFALAAAIAASAHAPSARVAIDATKSRQWVVSPQTAALLTQLPSGWRMTWIAPEGALDVDIAAQIEEVVETFAHSKVGFVERIDPTTSEGVAQYATWLARIVEERRGDPQGLREALADALSELTQLTGCAARAADQLERAAVVMPAGDPDRSPIEQSAGALRALATGGPVLAASIESMRVQRADRALSSDRDAAQVLSQNHRDWAMQFGALSNWLASRALDASAREEMRELARQVRTELTARARALVRSADALEALPADPLSQLSIALAQGGAIVVESPAGIAVVSDGEMTVGSRDEREVVRFDRRFRIEQLVSAAIRSVLDSKRPQVILVHAHDKSVLDVSSDGNDASAISDALRAARIEVREWSVVTAAKPVAPADAVWLICPIHTVAIESDARERALLEAVGGLIASDSALFFSLGPSVRPLAGRSDPWAELAARLGVRATTDAIVVDDVPTSEGQTERRTRIEAVANSLGGIVAQALASQQIGLPVALPLAPIAADLSAGSSDILLVAQPRAGRSIERDWRRRIPDARAAFSMPTEVPVALSTTRSTVDGGSVRAIVVGSGAWMMSATVDALRSESGSREVLLNPGNREFAVNGALWLAGLDQRIGHGGSGREAPRIGALSTVERLQITGLVSLCVPLLALLVAVCMGWWRGRR